MEEVKAKGKREKGRVARRGGKENRSRMKMPRVSARKELEAVKKKFIADRRMFAGIARSSSDGSLAKLPERDVQKAEAISFPPPHRLEAEVKVSR